MALLSQYGFQCAESFAVESATEAKAAALKLGYPVILKGMAPNVAHRSEAGLVSRKIVNDGELDREFCRPRGQGEWPKRGEIHRA